MTERAPSPEPTAEQIASNETAAYAMKPEMDKIARDRAIAPRTGILAMREGGTVMIEAPHIDETQAKVHEARRFYADRDAKGALEAEATLNNPTVTNASDIAEADKNLRALTSHRLPRSEAGIRRIVEK
jgi:hypothetical protein